MKTVRQLLNNKRLKKDHPFTKDETHPGRRANYTPIKVKGTIVPWDTTINSKVISDYALVTSSGSEYFLVTNGDWKSVLSQFIWTDIHLKGDLNHHNMTIIPKEIKLDDSINEKHQVISLKKSKKRKKVLKKLSNFGSIITILPMVAQSY